jgi:hypothetical protein
MTLGGAALTSVEKNSRPQLMSQRTSCTLYMPNNIKVAVINLGMLP